MKFGWTYRGQLRHKGAMMLAAALLSFTGISPLALEEAYAAQIKDISVHENEMIVKFDAPIRAASAFTLAGPDRLALDLIGGEVGRVNARHSRRTVRNVRWGQFRPDVARIVLDLNHPAAIVKGRFEDNGKRLRLRLSDKKMTNGPRGGFYMAAPTKQKSHMDRSRHKAYKSDRPSRQQLAYLSVQRESGTAAYRGRNLPVNTAVKPLVVIDPGHGGRDPGAISPHGGHREKDVTLRVAREIAARLRAGGRVRVALTRDTDKFLPLKQRYAIAQKMQANLFISVHADAAHNHSASGATVYTLSEVASDREASRLAARENQSHIIGGVDLGGTQPDVSSILIDLTQRETMNISARFARLLHREGSSTINFRKSPHRFASFVVLKAPDVPSILLEAGYLTNNVDVERLTSKSGRNKFAEGVARSIELHFAQQMAWRSRMEKRGPANAQIANVKNVVGGAGYSVRSRQRKITLDY